MHDPAEVPVKALVFRHSLPRESLAFVAGWAALLVTYPASIAVIAHVFASTLVGKGASATTCKAALTRANATAKYKAPKVDAWADAVSARCRSKASSPRCARAS